MPLFMRVEDGALGEFSEEEYDGFEEHVQDEWERLPDGEKLQDGVQVVHVTETKRYVGIAGTEHEVGEVEYLGAIGLQSTKLGQQDIRPEPIERVERTSVAVLEDNEWKRLDEAD